MAARGIVVGLQNGYRSSQKLAFHECTGMCLFVVTRLNQMARWDQTMLPNTM